MKAETGEKSPLRSTCWSREIKIRRWIK